MAAEQKAVESTVTEETDQLTATEDHSAVTDRADQPAAMTEDHSDQVKEEASATESHSMAREEASDQLRTTAKEDLSATESHLTEREDHSTEREDHLAMVRENHSVTDHADHLVRVVKESHSVREDLSVTAKENHSVTDHADHSEKVAKESHSVREDLSATEETTTEEAESHSAEVVTSTTSVTRMRAESTR